MACVLRQETLGLQNLAVFEFVVLVRILASKTGRSVILVHRTEFIRGFGRASEHLVEVKVREDSIVRNNVVVCVRLEVVRVRETCGIGMTQPERHPGVPIVNGVAVLSLQELEDVVLYNGCLPHSSRLSAGSLTGDAVTEGKNVLVRIVLHRVPVDINTAVSASKTGVY